MDYLVVAVASLLAAGLTLYSGFGLGTLLLPVFALFFPVEVAVAATAVVHGANNVFKVSLLGRHADRDTVLRFGIPAVFAAIIGAALLGWFSVREAMFTWSLGGWEAQITPLKLVMAGLMFFFALFELLPRFRSIRFERKHYFVGGFLSGFFGGLSGHQGALRSAFLVKTGMDTKEFVGTASTIGLLVDAVRLVTYFGLLLLVGQNISLPAGSAGLVIVGCLAAFAGVLIGKRYLDKVTMGWVQNFTGVLLLLIAFLLGFGLI
ncbi:MAG: TSUP family transporter [Pseudomonadota bacterium]